jgi:hypothetical protein
MDATRVLTGDLPYKRRNLAYRACQRALNVNSEYSAIGVKPSLV